MSWLNSSLGDHGALKEKDAGVVVAHRPWMVLLVTWVVLLPVIVSASEPSQMPESELRLEIHADELTLHEGEISDLRVHLVNPGAATSIEHDPSCLLGFWVSRLAEVDVVVHEDVPACRGQAQTLDLEAGERILLGVIEWEPDDATMTGSHRFSAHMPGTNLSVDHTLLVEAAYPDLPDASMTLGLATAGEEMVDGSMTQLTVRLNAPAGGLDLPNDPLCRMDVTVTRNDTLLQSDRSIPCPSNSERLLPFETRVLGRLMLDSKGWGPGAVTLRVEAQGGSLGTEVVMEILPTDQPRSPTPTSDLELSVWTPRVDHTYGQEVEPSLIIENRGDAQLDLIWPTSCRARYVLVNQLGQAVFDSSKGSQCIEVPSTFPLEADGGRHVVPLQAFPFQDDRGCDLPSGAYEIIIDAPALGRFATQSIQWEGLGSASCDAVDVGLIEGDFQNDGDRLHINASLIPDRSTLIQWGDACTAQVILFSEANQGLIEAGIFDEGCETPPPPAMLLRANESMDLVNLRIDLEVIGVDQMPTVWTLRMLTMPPIEARFNVTTDERPSVEPDQTREDRPEDDPISTMSEASLVQGSWTFRWYDGVACYVLHSDTDHVVDGRTLGSWSPRNSWTGLYEIAPSNRESPCSSLAPLVEVRSVISETPPPPVMLNRDQPSNDAGRSIISTDVVASESPEALSLPMVTVVATTSMFMLLAGILLTNESIRIPATAALLSIGALIGRTTESADGGFQRGRIVGYLVANPGVHFRALMGALDMSNGQLTHHLRILEDEQRIWRRKDGRLIRFYPASVAHDTPDDDLPMPALSPDTNSLQGRILKMLDEDGEMASQPTQADLARRLERSQQLISHHLRTLQRYGLVEKRKVGVRHRYMLTKEARFILETSSNRSLK